LAVEAQRIAQSSIIVDTHIDVPYRLASRPADVSQATDSGERTVHVDIHACRA
jgi:membrane dipeptidase